MKNGNKQAWESAANSADHPLGGTLPGAAPLHPAWRAFLQFCLELQHGDIERLRIQDGLPVLAEVTKKKVKFGP